LEWTKEEQYNLEESLKKNKKELFNNNSERWKQIALEIPDKSIKDCLNHTKYIINYLKNKENSKIFYQFKNNINDFKQQIILYDIINQDNQQDIMNQNDILIIYNIEMLFDKPLEDIYQNLLKIITSYNMTIENVYFSTFDFKSCFSIKSFTKYYCKKFKLTEKEMIQKLWDNNFYCGKLGWIKESNTCQRSFCLYILNPILQIYNAVINEDKDKILKMLNKLEIKVKNYKNFYDIMNNWFPIKKNFKLLF